jgi:acyl-CoA thioesterase I
VERVRKLLAAEGPSKWIFLGDSITHGALHTFGWRDYVELFAERLRFELGRPMDLVINTGISGDNTRGLLATFDWRVGQFGPAAVLVMIGMNDCSANSGIGPDEFAANLHCLTDRIEACQAVPVMQTTCPIVPGLAPDREPQFDRFMDAIRQVAADRRLPLIDHHRFWLECRDRHLYWMSDAFHPNEFGHRAFAVRIFQDLGIFDPNSHSCRFHLP